MVKRSFAFEINLFLGCGPEKVGRRGTFVLGDEDQGHWQGLPKAAASVRECGVYQHGSPEGTSNPATLQYSFPFLQPPGFPVTSDASAAPEILQEPQWEKKQAKTPCGIQRERTSFQNNLSEGVAAA
ncbi:UNVERIFIED_CONTAM: hypothetical protein FKN15_066450 [Acipenser sinensis]